MRSMYGPDQLLLASKKPRIKELIELSVMMTPDEIKLLNEKPDVIRGLLLIKEFGYNKGTVFEKIADKMIEIHGIHFPDDYSKTEGTIYIIKIDMWLKQGSSDIELKKGWHWIRTIDEKILISNSGMLESTSNLLIQLIDNSEFLLNGHVNDFYELDNQRRSKLI